MENLTNLIKKHLKTVVEEVEGRDDGTYMIISNLEQMKKDIDKILSYKDTPYFHKDIQDFNKQVYRDNLKQELLQKNGIQVIYVPYSVEMNDLEDFIKKELKKYSYSFD